MKIKVTDPIKDAEGKAIETPDGPLTLRAVFNHALSSTVPNEIIPAEKKSKMFGLNLKLYKSNELELTSDEAALIKERVDTAYTSPLVYGRVCELLDK